MRLTLLLVAPSTTFAQSDPATAIEQFISSETFSMGDTNDPAQLVRKRALLYFGITCATLGHAKSFLNRFGP
jgi:hypothetical protein